MLTRCGPGHQEGHLRSVGWRRTGRRWLAALTIITALVSAGAVAVLTGPMAAAAAPQCPPGQPDCSIGDDGVIPGDDPGDDGGGGSTGGGGSACTWQGEPVDCVDPILGFFSEGCYYKVVDPQPDGLPEGTTRYLMSCIGGEAGVEVDLTETPAGPPPPNPEDVAWDILATITLRGPEIGMAPKSTGEDANARGLVGLPVWMWTEQGVETWGPNTATDTQLGVTVTISARATKIVWDMGDGTTITCTDPGTPYNPSYGDSPSPDCGYDTGYQRSSRKQPGGKYTVTATTTWQVDWEGEGEAGTLDPPQIRESQTSIVIDELQVVNR